MTAKSESAIEPSLKETVAIYAIFVFMAFVLLSVSDSMRPPYMEAWKRAGLAILSVGVGVVAWRWQTR